MRVLVSATLVAVLGLTGCEPAIGVYQEPIGWRPSVAVGQTNRGRLIDGVQLPASGPNHISWDPVGNASPNRGWRRWGTDQLVRTTLCTVDDYRAAHPTWPRVVIGDLSRPTGGPFGPRYGGLGHLSHQNGLDVDVYYPRRDGRETAPRRAAEVDLNRSQELVNRFIAAGATEIYVGMNIRVRGPGRIVRRLRHHDDHMHVRFALMPIEGIA